MNHILLIEDDGAIVRTLTSFLHDEGFSVRTADGQAAAIALMEASAPDLALVDITLREGSGFAVCAYAKAHDIPVIFLTASGDEYSVVTGLDMGADDYIAKPFRPRELISRIRSVLRRAGKRQNTIKVQDLVIDTEKATVTRGTQPIYLSALEYRLLLVFANNRGRVLSRERLLEEIWDTAGDFVNDNTLTVYIKRLREKLEADPQNPRYIHTVRGMGYQMDGDRR